MKSVLIILAIVAVLGAIGLIVGIIKWLQEWRKVKRMRKMVEELPEVQKWRRSQEFEVDLNKAMLEAKGNFSRAMEILAKKRGWNRRQNRLERDDT
jgi:hypothetical protein